MLPHAMQAAALSATAEAEAVAAAAAAAAGSSPPPPFTTLPPEMLGLIYGHLPTKEDRRSFAHSCKVI